MRTFVALSTVVAIILFIWTISTYAIKVPAYLLPGPIEVAQRGLQQWDILLTSMLYTSSVAVAGLIIAILISIVLAPMSFFVSRDEGSFVAVLILLQSIPIVVLAPVLNIWLGNASFARIIISALFAVFPLSISLVRSLQEVPPDILVFGRAVGSTSLQLLRYILFPWALGGFFTGLRVAGPLALVGAIVAELSGSDRGIGYLMQVAQRRLDMELLFAGVFCASAGGLLFYAATVAAERAALPGRNSQFKS